MKKRFFLASACFLSIAQAAVKTNIVLRCPHYVTVTKRVWGSRLVSRDDGGLTTVRVKKYAVSTPNNKMAVTANNGAYIKEFNFKPDDNFIIDTVSNKKIPLKSVYMAKTHSSCNYVQGKGTFVISSNRVTCNTLIYNKVPGTRCPKGELK